MISGTELKWDEAGLVTVVAQDAETGEIRMVAHANAEALSLTLSTGFGHFWSRSREAIWQKGEESGNTLKVREVWADCDGDALIYMVDPEGPSCHTGAETCFFKPVSASAPEPAPAPASEPESAPESEPEPAPAPESEPALATAAPTLLKLTRTLAERTTSDAEQSYTKSLLDKGAVEIAEKIREEALELGAAIKDEGDDRVTSEAGDVIYHLLVGLLLRKIPVRAVLRELSSRFGQSGHEEKESRTSNH